jgi:type III secretion protein U
MSEKTEQPTQKKLDDSRKEGQVPQRKNVLEAAIVTAGVFGVTGLWDDVAAGLLSLFDAVFDSIEDGFDHSLAGIWKASLDTSVTVAALIVGLGFGLLLLNLLLNGFNFAPKALSPKFEKLNPVNGLKGMFSKHTAYNFVRLLVYFTAVSLILYMTLKNNLADTIRASACGLTCLAQIFPPMINTMVTQILLVLIILALVDFRLQDMMFISQNKMSKDDIKREYKGSQGDPMIKGMRNQLAHEDMRLPSPREVTHVIYANGYLVALLYKPGSTPFVVMKAKGESVPSIQARFRRMGVRCVNLPAVAREFYMKYAVSAHTDAQSAIGMSKVLRMTGELGAKRRADTDRAQK